MKTFEELIEELEMAVETVLRHSDKAVSDRALLILHRAEGVANAIDDWRQG